MGRAKLYIAFVVLASLLTKARAQQTIQFSQYVFNGLALNPAYAGYKDDWTLNLSSRLQWTGINGAPQTGTASIDGVLNSNNNNVGLGLIATFDRVGPESTTSVYANYAYRLRLDELDTKRLCFGLAFGGIQYSIDGSKFNPGDVNDGSVPTSLQSKLTPDFKFGVYYYSPNIYVGASLYNLLASTVKNSSDNSAIIKQTRTLYLTAGTMLSLSDELDMKPSFMIKEDFKAPTNIDLTSYIVLKKRVWLGASYRFGVTSFGNTNLQSGLDHGDAAAALARFYINDHFAIGYSFDFTTSKLANYQNGSHELSVSLGFPGKKPRVVSPRYF